MTDGVIIVNVPKGGFLKKWKPQGFQFCMESWLMMSEYTQLSLDEFEKLPGDRFMIVSIYEAAKAYTQFNPDSKEKKFRYTEDQVKSWLDEMPTKDSQSIVKCMLESRLGGKAIKDLIEEKKK
jgi:hypothetical protein